MSRIGRGLSGAIVALLAFCAIAAATVPRAGRYGGTTSQTYPDGSPGAVSLKLTHGGRRLRSFDINWLAPCDSGFTTLSQGTHAQGSLTSRGRFHGRGTYTSQTGNLAGTPYTATISDRIRGDFTTRRRGDGVFQATAVLRDSSGRQVSTCTSPRISWVVRRS